MPHAKVDLVRRIEAGTWRYIGQRLNDIDLSQIPIAGKDRRLIHRRFCGRICAVGHVNLANAFVIERPPLRLLYVRPGYRNYRNVAVKVFSTCPWKVDFDHALSRQLAERLGYGYVLLLRIDPGINRAHGRFEKPMRARRPAPRCALPTIESATNGLGGGPTFGASAIPTWFSMRTTQDVTDLRSSKRVGGVLRWASWTRHSHQLTSSRFRLAEILADRCRLPGNVKCII